MDQDRVMSLWDANGNWNLCRFCVHLHSMVGHLTCNAFPEGIPQEFTSGVIFHNKPMLGQENHIVFAPRI